MAVEVIADKVLGQPNASENDVIAALSTGALSVEQIVALRSAEQVEMARVEQVRVGAFIADTQRARQQNVELAREKSPIAWGASAVSILILAGFFGAVYLLFLLERNWDKRTVNLLNVLFSALTARFTQVVNFWHGNSAGSKRSSDAVRKIGEQVVY